MVELRRAEATILLTYTPECYVSEGLAELGSRYTLGDDARAGLLQKACRVAGLPVAEEDVARQLSISASLHRVDGSDGDAALMLHAEGRARADVAAFLCDEALMSPARALKRIEFLEHPLWRTYVFSYAGGETLLGRWCDGAGPSEGARARFFRLLTEQLTPAGIEEDLEAGSA